MHKLIDAFRLPNPHTRTIAPHMNSIISTIPSLPGVDSEQLHARDLGGGRATPDHPRKRRHFTPNPVKRPVFLRFGVKFR
ncbi:hypothetical protein ACQXZW_10985, partial [Corynebacterium diphtheriae]